ncbi:M56 family metallopeptidase, partial [Roseisolibacter sp. H3M3-2]|uniref:M56 family metallopeptidase n=1 Tax=Roseisolibacter sp. H3M3-2 TaxID=3031323 RepID=UPI0023DB499D
MIALLTLATVAGGLALALAAARAERALRLWGRPARGAWAVALAATLALPAVTLWLSPVVGDALLTLAAAGGAPATIPGLLELPAVVVHAARTPAVDWLAWLDRALALVWIGAAVGGLLALVRAARTLRRAARDWRADAVDGVPVAVSADLGPAVLGVRRPRIVLPSWALGLERPLRARVLRHEAEHARAGDTALLLAAAALVALTPWNPAAWWIARRQRRAVEIDCEARVLRAHPDVSRYGLLLLAVAQRRDAAPLPALAALSALAPARSDLARRIEAMRERQVG